MHKCVKFPIQVLVAFYHVKNVKYLENLKRNFLEECTYVERVIDRCSGAFICKNKVKIGSFEIF